MLPHVRAAAQHLPLHRCCTRAGLETFRRSWSLLHGLWEEVSGSLSGSGLAVSLGNRPLDWSRSWSGHRGPRGLTARRAWSTSVPEGTLWGWHWLQGCSFP
jgi:hypothetical protein